MRSILEARKLFCSEGNNAPPHSQENIIPASTNAKVITQFATAMTTHFPTHTLNKIEATTTPINDYLRTVINVVIDDAHYETIATTIANTTRWGGAYQHAAPEISDLLNIDIDTV
ncbi:hypothetical protein [Corynebacterium crudilactis]|uniref:hypothetical protein n=1 Tax=Corynebacterium crudilactis TaxID=1652495 RepID=UPI0012FE0BC3|nr:hypothetical protein [Corynebacterium crudilactis]